MPATARTEAPPPPAPLLPAAAPTGRRERRRLEVRARLLQAAHSLFEERGVHASTVAGICERADVAHKTFFNHFPSRQDLLRAMADDAIERLLVTIAEARLRGTDTASRLAAFFDAIAVEAAAAGPMHRELLTEIIHVAQASGDEPEKARRLHDAFGAIVEEGIEAGDVTRLHGPDTLTEAVLGAYYALMFQWANIEGYPIADRARATARLLGETLAARPGEALPVAESQPASQRRAASAARISRKERTHRGKT